MANMDFSQAFTYSDINKVYLMAVELSGGLVSQHGSVQLERIFQDSTLYAQVTALRNEMESILQNFTGASEYDDTATYAVGDYCTKDDYLYQCSTAVSAESWDASKWDVVTISSQYTMLKNILGVDDYSTSASYAVGDLVVYDGKMYRCITAVSSEAWDASKWSETDFVAESESIMTEIQTEGAAQVANIQSVYAEDLGNVSSRVQSNSKRIANLEDKSAPYTIEYPNTDYGKGDIPANVEKGAVVKSVDGNTRPFCQLCKTDSNSGGATSGTVADVTWSLADGVVTLNGTASANGQIIFNNFSLLSIPRGHVLLLSGRAYSANYGMYEYAFRNSSNSIFLDRTISATEIKTLTDDVTSVYFAIRVYSGDTFSNQKMRVPQVYDLTLYCEGQNVPTTVAEALALNHEFGKYHSFDDGSLVKLKVGGYRFTSRNRIAESNIELGGISPVGVPYEATSGTWWRNADFIEVKPASAYYVKLPSGYTTANANIYAYYYDEDENFISRGVNVAGTVITTPNNCFKVKLNYYFVTATLVTPTEICLNISDSQNGTYTAHSSQTVEFSSPVELGKAGSVKDRLDTLDNVVKRNVGSVIITDSNLSTGSDNGTRALFSVDLEDDINYTDASATPNISAFGLTAVSQNASWGAGNCSASTSSSTKIYIIFATGTTRAEVLSYFATRPILYELASPTTEEISVPSAIEVEPYGTIELIQVQDVEIDTEFSVQYIPDSQYLTKSMVVDSLSSESTDVPLSANQGRILAEKIARNTKAIANIIEKEGEVSISYPDSIYGKGEVPSGMAKYAEVRTLRGVSRVANQLLDKSFGSSTTINNVTFTNNGDGSWSISTNGTASGTAYVQLCNDVPTLGHKWLIAGCPSGGSGLSGFTLWDASNSAYDNGSGVVFSPTNAINVYIRVASGTSIPTPIVYWPVLTDLNVYFGSDPSVDVSTLTIADIQQNYPELLVPSDYDAGSIVDTTYSAVESYSTNILDNTSFVKGRVEAGVISYAADTSSMTITETGVDFTVTSTWRGVVSELTRVKPSTTYTLNFTAISSVYAFISEYTSSNSYITTSVVHLPIPSTFTTSATTGLIRLSFQLSVVGSVSITNPTIKAGNDGTYIPHLLDTLLLPSPVTLRSAGSVADTDELCVEVSEGVFKRRQTKNCDIVNLGDLSWDMSGSVFYSADDIGALATSGITCICTKYKAVSNVASLNPASANSDKTVCLRNTTANRIYIKDSSYADAATFKTAMNGVYLTYALADPVVTLFDPILDNFLPTEAGGTITPKQTQTKQIDTSFDVAYLAL